MKRISAALLCLALLFSADAEEWKVGSFHIQWPDGYAHLNKPGINQFLADDGTGVTVDVVGHPTDDASVELKQEGQWRDYARNYLIPSAQKHGSIVVPLTEEKLSSGSTLMTFAVEEKGLFKTSFGLYFLVISPRARLAQIVVEGSGTVKEHLPKFRPLFESVKWDE